MTTADRLAAILAILAAHTTAELIALGYDLDALDREHARLLAELLES